MKPKMVAIDIKIGPLASPFEFKENLLPFCRCGHFETLAVPSHGVGHLIDWHFECLVFIESVRECHCFPILVVERGGFRPLKVADFKAPTRVEVKSLPCRKGGRE